MPAFTSRIWKYALQVVDPYGDEVLAYVFPINPQAYVHSETARASITQTLGGAFLDDYGIAPTYIHIEGSCGFRTRRVGMELLDPVDQLLRIRELWQRSKDKDEQSRLYRAYFYDFELELYWWVHLDKFDIKATVDRNFQYFYSIDMICLSEVNQPPPSDDLELRFYQSRGEVLASINTKLAALMGWTGNGDLATTYLRYAALAALRGELSTFLGDMIGSVTGAITGAVSLQNLPFNQINSVADSLWSFISGNTPQSDQLALAIQNGDAPPELPTVFADAYEALVVLGNIQGVLVGDPEWVLPQTDTPGHPVVTTFDPQRLLRTLINAGYTPSKRNLSPGNNVALRHVVIDGQTLEGLAALYYGDASLWTLIADFNPSLFYPSYKVVFDGLKAGDIVFIPAVVPTGAPKGSQERAYRYVSEMISYLKSMGGY